MKTRGRGIIFFMNSEAINESIKEGNYCLNLDTFSLECDIEVANGVAEVTTEKGEKYIISNGYIIKWIK
jgi:frataxin-like iron-binding protein CyaY